MTFDFPVLFNYEIFSLIVLLSILTLRYFMFSFQLSIDKHFTHTMDTLVVLLQSTKYYTAFFNWAIFQQMLLLNILMLRYFVYFSV